MLPVFCITLKEKPARRAQTEAEFAKYGIKVEFWRGINGHNWGVKTGTPLHHDGGFPYYIGPHQIAISLSHWMMWNLLEHSGLQEAMIIEDDVALCDDFVGRFEEGYNELPSDWEWAFVGSCCCAGKLVEQLTPRIADIRWPMCSHCYIVKVAALEKAMDHMEELRAPCDIAIIENVFSKNIIKAYTFWPSLAAQHGTYLPP